MSACWRAHNLEAHKLHAKPHAFLPGCGLNYCIPATRARSRVGPRWRQDTCPRLRSCKFASKHRSFLLSCALALVLGN